METYLYFRKFRPATFTSTQGSATQALGAPSVASIGGAVDAAGAKISSVPKPVIVKFCVPAVAV